MNAPPSPEAPGDDLRNLWRFMAFSRPYWIWVVIGSVTGLVRMALQLYMPVLSKRVTDEVILAPDLSQGARMGHLWWLILPFVGWLIVHGVATLGRIYWSQVAAMSAIRDIRFHLFDHLQRLSLAFHTRRPTGEIVSRLMNDVGTAQYIFDLVLIQLLQQILIAGVATVLLVMRDWLWALVCFATLPIYLITTRCIRRPMRQASREMLETTSRMSGQVHERMTMIREVQAFTAESHEKRRVRREVETLKRYALRQQMLSAFLLAASEITRYLGIVVMLVFGTYRILSGHATVGDLLLFSGYQALLLGPLEFFSNLYTQLHSTAAAADRVFEFLDTESEVGDAPGARRLLPQRPPTVTFEGVQFSYPTDNPAIVLRDISFEAKPGWRVVLVGESGAGKSTLMNILPRFYDVQQGAIRIDGQDIRAVKLRSLRRAIGIVPQEAVLFSGTVWDNILYGRRDAPRDEVCRAARLANAEGFILELPEGYSTIVGERGVGLSGGQIQRIAIARAFLKDPAILILDEATANLDAVSESQVLEALDRLATGRTTFIIAHRLSVARNADLIVVLANGAIVERGTHEELLATGGVYHDLWERQMLGRVRE
jgi:ABC-type multidrug transport system fused ATPase/permease subunit